MVGERFGMKKQERIQQIQKTPYLCKTNAPSGFKDWFLKHLYTVP